MTFEGKIIYATPGFVELCTPQSNYGMKGSLALFLNPVMHLAPEQQIVCRRDFELLKLRIADTVHRFYQETLINAMQAASSIFSISTPVCMVRATFRRKMPLS